MNQFTIVFERYAFHHETTWPCHRWTVTCEHCGAENAFRTTGDAYTDADNQAHVITGWMHHHVIGCEAGR